MNKNLLAKILIHGLSKISQTDASVLSFEKGERFESSPEALAVEFEDAAGNKDQLFFIQIEPVSKVETTLDGDTPVVRDHYCVYLPEYDPGDASVGIPDGYSCEPEESPPALTTLDGVEAVMPILTWMLQEDLSNFAETEVMADAYQESHSLDDLEQA